MKLIPFTNPELGQFTHGFFCPGCRCAHGIVEGHWTITGTPERPTISPSILVRGHLGPGPDGQGEYGVCHSFVTDGKIQFLDDSTHHLAGQTVDLPKF